MSPSTERLKKIVILIQGNPLESHRPTEGIRIALGLAASGHSVDLILTRQAPLLLTEAQADCVDSESAKLYLDTLKKFITAFSIEKESHEVAGLLHSAYPIAVVERRAIAQAIAAAECFISF